MLISQRQNDIGKAVNAGKKVILLEGPMGTSKTFGAAIALITQAINFPGSVIGVGRKNRPEIRKGTLLSFREAAYEMGLVRDFHFKENQSELSWKFMGAGEGSYIYFIEMNHNADPGFLKLKGLNLTCGMIDEADAVIKEGFTMLNGRVGRMNKNGAPSFLILACNANEGWIKEDYYDKYHHPEESGPLPENTEVIEFQLEDSFLDDEYYLKQMDSPAQYVQRYIYNNWDFGDDLYSLFKYRHMDRAHVQQYEDTGSRILAIDAARVTDRTVGAMIDGDVLVDIHIFKDRKVEMDYDEQAVLVHDYCEKEGIGWENVYIDAIGEGSGLIIALKTMYGWEVRKFVSGATSLSKLKLDKMLSMATSTAQKLQIKQRMPVVYKNLRSEQIYGLSSDIENGKFHFYAGCPFLGELKKEATMHNVKTGSMMEVEGKDSVKERTKHSPDIFDAVVMAYYGYKRVSASGSYSARPVKDKPRAPQRDVKPRRRGKMLTAGLRGAKF